MLDAEQRVQLHCRFGFESVFTFIPFCNVQPCYDGLMGSDIFITTCLLFLQVRELYDQAVLESECLGLGDPGLEKVSGQEQQQK